MADKTLKTRNNDKVMWALLTVLLIFRVTMILAYPLIIKVMPMWEWTNNDGYEDIAVNWIEQGVFALQEDCPTASRLPLYPGLIAACYAVVGFHPVSVMLLQVLLSVATGFMLYGLAKNVFDRRTAVISLLLFILHPQVNNFVFRCATETVFVFLTMGLLYFTVRYLQTEKRKDLLLVAVFLGLSLLTRQTFMYLALLSIPVIVIFRVRKQGIVRISGHMGLAVATVVLIVTPWLARNYALSGHFPVLQTWVGQPLFQGTYVSMHMSEFLQGNKTISELDQDALGLINAKTDAYLSESMMDHRPVAREVMADQHARHLAYQGLMEDPISSIQMAMINLFLAPVLQMTWKSTAMLMIWNWPLLLVCCVGVCLSFFKKRKAFFGALPVVIVFGYLLSLHAIVWPQARYILPGLIPFTIFAGYALSKVWPLNKIPNDEDPEKLRPGV